MPALERRLRGGEAGNGEAKGGAGDVVQAEFLAELDRAGVPAMLAANAELQGWAGLASPVRREPNQLADAIPIEGDEWISCEDAAACVGAEKRRCVVTRKAEGGLGEIVGAEGEEFGTFGNFARPQGGTGQLDHGTDTVGDLDAALRGNGGRCCVDQRLYAIEL